MAQSHQEGVCRVQDGWHPPRVWTKGIRDAKEGRDVPGTKIPMSRRITLEAVERLTAPGWGSS